MFASATSARLQEIGPRFTLKLRWLRKGLPAVTAGDGQVPRGGDPEDIDEEEISRQEKRDEDEAMEEMGKGQEKRASAQQMGIPPLDEEQEYEWKWKVSRISCNRLIRRSCHGQPKMEVSRRTFFL
jgi:ribosome production factor 1